MEFMTFQHSNILLLLVVPLSQRQGQPLVTLILLNLCGLFLDDRTIWPGSSWGIGIRFQGRRFLHQGGKPPRSTHWSGRRFHHSGVLPSLRQGLLNQGHGLTSRTQMAMGIRCERVDSTVLGFELVNNRADGPCRKQAPSDLELWQSPYLRRSGRVDHDGAHWRSHRTPVGSARGCSVRMLDHT